ncbi:DUF664 domain-containing protein [Aquimarina sp. AD1]|uniref:DinB family protein n=2 Tax=Aquimarina sp. (strain AD1) TaxID=1714848 RepID=UPI000E50D633|nr:DUF664 domain-containing protein [Aquimarina sp. AD1]AXT58007.1 DUF664 domain-containing protein [Aquimarina sp. AD1]
MKISQDWNSFCQCIDLANKIYDSFKLTALVKAKIKSPKSSAALWARVENADGGIDFFDDMTDRRIQSSQWMKYEVNGIIDINSSKLYFGGFCTNQGEFYFKSFRLFLSNKKETKEVIINNPNFDKVKSQLLVPGWTQGIGNETPNQILEYNFISEVSEYSKESHLKITYTDNFKNLKDYDCEVYELLRMLEDVSIRMIRSIQNLTIDQLDYRINLTSNSIALLIMHISAVESFYQVFTFENRTFNNTEKKRFESILKMDSKAQETFVNFNIEYYISYFHEIRSRTLENFKKKSNGWLKNRPSISDKNNHYHWLHVLEHQSYHIGQIELLKKLMN